MQGVSEKQRVRFFEHIKKRPALRIALLAIGVPLWVIVSFYVANFIILSILQLVALTGVNLLVLVGESVLQAVVGAIIQSATLLIALGVPFWLFRTKIKRATLGLKELLPTWRDVMLAPLFYIAAFFTSVFMIAVIGQIFPSLNLTTDQSVGIDSEFITQRYELILAYVTLTIVVPIVEEVLFRGYLHGMLRKRMPAWPTYLITAITFSALHLGIGRLDEWQWNVAIDTFFLSIWLGILREKTGGVWAGILVHMIKNSIAFFFMFVMPVVSPGMGY